MVISRPWAVIVGIAVSGMALAAPAVAPGAPAERVAAASKVTVSCVAVQATKTGHGQERPVVDAAISAIEEVVCEKDSARYDTYRFLWKGTQTVAFEEEASLRINERYTVFVTPLSEDRQGRIRVAVRVEEERDPKGLGREEGKRVKPVVALSTTSLLVPGNHLKLDGLNLEEGKLIVVLSVKGS